MKGKIVGLVTKDSKFPILGGRLLKQLNNFWECCYERFPILGGRLLKITIQHGIVRARKFPILGGRLLKKTGTKACIRNMWFPILGGRLLKKSKLLRNKTTQKVSNPWREAIEET